MYSSKRGNSVLSLTKFKYWFKMKIKIAVFIWYPQMFSFYKMFSLKIFCIKKSWYKWIFTTVIFKSAWMSPMEQSNPSTVLNFIFRKSKLKKALTILLEFPGKILCNPPAVVDRILR